MSGSMTATYWLLGGLGRLTWVPVERQLADLARRSYDHRLARRLHQAGNGGTVTFVPGAFHDYPFAF